jgi:hypothetical protein
MRDSPTILDFNRRRCFAVNTLHRRSRSAEDGVAPNPLVCANNAWQLTMPTVEISSNTPTT